MLELGKISVLYGSLESTVNLAINNLSGYSQPFDFRCSIMLIHANFQQRVDILATLFEQISNDYPELSKYENVIKLIKRSQKGRNKFMHSNLIFISELQEVQLSALTARGSLKIKGETIYINELKEVSAVTHEAMCALYTIITGNEIKPLWKRNV